MQAARQLGAGPLHGASPISPSIWLTGVSGCASPRLLGRPLVPTVACLSVLLLAWSCSCWTRNAGQAASGVCHWLVATTCSCMMMACVQLGTSLLLGAQQLVLLVWSMVGTRAVASRPTPGHLPGRLLLIKLWIQPGRARSREAYQSSRHEKSK